MGAIVKSLSNGLGGHTDFEERDSSTRRYTTSPPHQSPSVTASPRGEAYATTVRWGDYYGISLHKPYRVCQRLPLGGKVGRPKAGSDEGERLGFPSVGHRPTGPRWQRDSTTRRYSTSPPHQSPSVPASPQGEAYVLCCVEVITTVFFYISHTGLAKSLPLGGKVGRRSRVG